MQEGFTLYIPGMTPSPTTPPARPRSPLWIIVLGLACEEPMHPYRMQTLIRQRGKDQVANAAQRNSVYQTIAALERAGLLAARETTRDENRPERTVYEATPEGRKTLRGWVRNGLATPAREYPEFPAVLSTLYGPDDSDDFAELLRQRVDALMPRLHELEQPYPQVPRLFLLEIEYMAVLVRAEIKWLSGVIGDLESGKLDYPTEAELRAIGAGVGGPSEQALQELIANRPAKRRRKTPRSAKPRRRR
jgi:DNA-binding PadR family transcriptional regulator